MSKFDPETEAQLREAFEFGAKGMPTVNWQSLGHVIRFLGQNPSPNELQNIMSENGAGGSMDSNAFMKMMAKRYKTAEGEEDLIEAFRVFDKDGKGDIASGELRHLLTNLGERLEAEQVNSMMQEVIPGAAGNLKYEPFIRYVMNL